MNPEHLENLAKAAQTANLLKQDVRAAHKAACQSDGVLEILLRDLLDQAVKLENRLNELEACF